MSQIGDESPSAWRPVTATFRTSAEPHGGGKSWPKPDNPKPSVT